MVAITLAGVTKAFGQVLVLDGIDLDVVSGEFLVLLGPSGCGKSTTLRIVAGLEQATSGDILVDGIRINELPARERDMAMVFQHYGLYPHMTVQQNIAYPLRLRKVPKDEQNSRVREVASMVELEPFLERKPKELSGGQRQRVALARAIIRQPNVFLLDEPLSNLDAKLRVSMRSELNRLHHEFPTTTIYVTHDQIEAMTLASRVAVMNEGRIVQLGTPQDIYNDPQDIFVASFVGTPEINRISGEIHNGAFVGQDIRLPGVRAPNASKAALCFRPMVVSLAEPEGAIAEGSVYSAEYGGDTTFVTVKIGGTLIMALVPPDRRFSFDQKVGLTLDPGNCYFFDEDSGLRIGQSGRTQQ